MDVAGTVVFASTDEWFTGGSSVHYWAFGLVDRKRLKRPAFYAAGHLVGLRSLVFDVWFYKDNGHFAPAYNPVTNEFGARYEYGLTTAAEFPEWLGVGDRWILVECASGVEHAPATGASAQFSVRPTYW